MSHTYGRNNDITFNKNNKLTFNRKDKNILMKYRGIFYVKHEKILRCRSGVENAGMIEANVVRPLDFRRFHYFLTSKSMSQQVVLRNDDVNPSVCFSLLIVRP